MTPDHVASDIEDQDASIDDHMNRLQSQLVAYLVQLTQGNRLKDVTCQTNEAIE